MDGTLLKPADFLETFPPALCDFDALGVPVCALTGAGPLG
jgi:hypothetical protein